MSRTYFRWNVLKDTSWVDENYWHVMDLEPGTATPYLEFMRLVHPEDREVVVEALRVQFERGGTQTSRFRLAKPPHKLIHSETIVDMNAEGKAYRLSGWMEEVE